MLIFAQAFDLFFRAAEDWKHMLDSVPTAGSRQEEAAAGLAPGPGGAGAALDARGGFASPGAAALGFRQGDPAEERFAQMSAAEIAEVTRAIADMKLPQAECAPAATSPMHEGYGSTCAGRCVVRFAPAARIIDIGNSAASTSRRRSWRCSIFQAR